MRRTSTAVLGSLPLALALVAEAAWVAVFAGLVDAFVLHEPGTGIAGLLLAAVAGFVAARRLPARTGRWWPAVAVVLAGVAGLLGWLASPEVRALLGAGGGSALGPALAANPGGWLAALAFARGTVHARLPVDPGRVGAMMVIAIPALALAAVVGGMIAEPTRTRFLVSAQAEVLVFLAASILALALARLGQVGRGAPIDWRRNPAWVGLAAVLVLTATALAAWVAATAGTAIAMAAYAIAVPLAIVGFVVGFDQRSLRIVLVSLAAVGIVGTILRVAAPSGSGSTGAAVTTPVVPGGPQATGPEIALAAFAALLLLVVVVALVALRLWLRRTPIDAAADEEVRFIDHSGAAQAPARPRRAARFRRRPSPADAVAAYRDLLDDLEGRPPVAREAGETPAEHARRLRALGHGGLALDLLAADYGLVRFAGEALSPAETRRAVRRAGRLRATLLRVPVAAPEPVSVAGARVGARPEPAGPRGARGGRRGAGPGADLPDADQPGALGQILTRIRRGP